MPTLQSMRQALGHLDPLLIDGITASAVFALLAQQLITRHLLLPGQHPTTALTWLLGVVSIAPILTHRRFRRASVAVCLSAVAIYAACRYANPGIAVFVLTFDIALHSEERESVPTLFASAVVLGVAVDLQPAKVAVLANISRERDLRRRGLVDRLEPAPPPGPDGRSSEPGPNAWSASTRKRPARPSPRSGCASPANCTTSSPTR